MSTKSPIRKHDKPIYDAVTCIKTIEGKGYTLSEIGYSIGVSRGQVSYIKNGKRKASDRLTILLNNVIANLEKQERQKSQVAASPPQVQRSTTTADRFYCASCPFLALVPFGLSAQQVTQWAKDHNCDTKKRGQCPN